MAEPTTTSVGPAVLHAQGTLADDVGEVDDEPGLLITPPLSLPVQAPPITASPAKTTSSTTRPRKTVFMVVLRPLHAARRPAYFNSLVDQTDEDRRYRAFPVRRNSISDTE